MSFCLVVAPDGRLWVLTTLRARRNSWDVLWGEAGYIKLLRTDTPVYVAAVQAPPK
jgi:hypothetical protein